MNKKDEMFKRKLENRFQNGMYSGNWTETKCTVA